MLNVPATHGLAVVVSVKMISFMVLAEFLSLMAAPVITSFILSESLGAAQGKYGRDKQI